MLMLCSVLRKYQTTRELLSAGGFAKCFLMQNPLQKNGAAAQPFEKRMESLFKRTQKGPKQIHHQRSTHNYETEQVARV